MERLSKFQSKLLSEDFIWKTMAITNGNGMMKCSSTVYIVPFLDVSGGFPRRSCEFFELFTTSTLLNEEGQRISVFQSLLSNFFLANFVHLLKTIEFPVDFSRPLKGVLPPFVTSSHKPLQICRVLMTDIDSVEQPVQTKLLPDSSFIVIKFGLSLNGWLIEHGFGFFGFSGSSSRQFLEHPHLLSECNIMSVHYIL